MSPYCFLISLSQGIPCCCFFFFFIIIKLIYSFFLMKLAFRVLPVVLGSSTMASISCGNEERLLSFKDWPIEIDEQSIYAMNDTGILLDLGSSFTAAAYVCQLMASCPAYRFSGVTSNQDCHFITYEQVESVPEK
ncbi:hypothetical protein [Microvirus mar36]|uniref:Uncharacterized protein n=1 Tax=Microvirus mar36 TaxID=2851170 RepID=A0A8F5MJ03_9VIRU|nr:hypothetical protein [Microvirus mar36]